MLPPLCTLSHRDELELNESYNCVNKLIALPGNEKAVSYGANGL